MALGRAPVRERVAGLRDELPAVARRQEDQLQHAEGFVVADLAVRDRRPEPTEVLPARADDELADASLRIGDSLRGLRCKPLVVVLVPVSRTSPPPS